MHPLIQLIVVTLIVFCIQFHLTSVVSKSNDVRVIDGRKPNQGDQAATIKLDQVKSSDARVVGGEVAKPNQFPYQAAVTSYTKNESMFCGGSLISITSILTAAHCVKGAVRIEIILGTNNLSDSSSAKIFDNITDYIIHPSWTNETQECDVAIVKLPEAVELNEKVGVINLASNPNELFLNEIATVSGWGKISDDAFLNITDILRFTSNHVVPNDVCIAVYGKNFTINENNICVSGVQGKSACNSDSGGPLTVTINNVTTQIGIVSFGDEKGCELGNPVVYSRITSYLDWINKNSSATNVKMFIFFPFVLHFLLMSSSY